MERPGSPKQREKKGLLKEKLELVKSRNSRITIRPIDETLTFDKGFYVFVRAVQMLKASNPGTIVVGVAGPSGSGKTAFSERVKSFMPGVALISMDMYNDGSKVIDDNFDDPRLTDYELLLSNLADLRDGKEVQIPVYDFRTSRRVGYRAQPQPEARVVLVEGIYALSERLRPLMDLRVSITGGVHFDLVKRVMRDIQRSGQGPEEIIQQITDTVYPMYKAFIEPDLQTAHLRIVNSFNPFSGFMNATYILKSKAVPPLERAAAVLESASGSRVTQRKEVDIYDIYLLPPNEDPETCQSWLRMRNRDGRYSLMFEEWVSEGAFIISPRISFEVNVRILGGLMALGYEIGTIMKRTSTVLSAEGPDELTVKLDDVEGLGRFVQLLGRDRAKVDAIGRELGLEGSYIPRSYIEQVQLERLTADFQTVTEDWKKKFSTRSGEVVLPDNVSGLTTPRTSIGGTPSAFGRHHSRADDHGAGAGPPGPALSSSAPTSAPLLIPASHSASSRPGSRQGSVAANGSSLLTQQLAAAERTPRRGGGPGEGNSGAAALAASSPVGGGRSVIVALQERLDELGGSAEQLGLQAQLDALVAQNKETNRQLGHLAAATSQLATNLQATLAAATAGGAGGGAAVPLPAWQLAAGAGVVVAAAVVAGLLVGGVALRRG